jgi:DNA polymerase-3 subunit epsilon
VKYAIIDIETTGGNAFTDRITEIALYVHDGEKVVDEFTSLLNPDRPIPPFVSRLTGISDEMVADAPRFHEIAKELVLRTEDCIFVAHNAQFDYSFIREEFRSLGYTYSRDYLCTVKLSRKILPGHPSYSLGNLCSRLGIQVENRHRAGGDAMATVKLFELLLKNDRDAFIERSIGNDHIHLRFPPGFDPSIIHRLPESTGVYFLHDASGNVIYIGKSNNIRKRILSHFANKQSRKAIELRNSIRDITFEVTGDELIALLLESEEIKKQQPLFNRAQRRTFFNYGIVEERPEKGYRLLKPVRMKPDVEPVLPASSMQEAKELLERLTRKFRLCQKLCGLYPAKHACFKYGIGQCDGACTGKEASESYNERVEAAIDSLRYRHVNFLIIGDGRTNDEDSVVQIENSKYVGFGYVDREFASDGIDTLIDAVEPRMDNRDVQRILRHFLNQGKTRKIIPY